jgi:hypothetical protein
MPSLLRIGEDATRVLLHTVGALPLLIVPSRTV